MSEEEYKLEVLGLPRGKGDPDSFGYPGDHDILCDDDCCKTDINKYINKLTRKDKRNGRRKVVSKTSRRN